MDSTALWTPVIDELQKFNGNPDQNRSLFYIFLMGFLGGLLALFTPCVWPIIPMTVSFFLKRSKDDKRKGIRDAITYGISIIVIYLALGLLITALFGASSLNALATNAVFNIFFFLLLVVFALSFFGWFEIRLPSKWSNAVDSKAGNTSGDGFHADIGELLLHGSYHRFPVGGSQYTGEHSRSGSRYVWLCLGAGFAFHALCLIPHLAEAGSKIRFLDEYHQGGVRLY